jgi:hypothetical protein
MTALRQNPLMGSMGANPMTAPMTTPIMVDITIIQENGFAIFEASGQAVAPSEGVGHRIGGTAGQHGNRQHSGPDDSEAE